MSHTTSYTTYSIYNGHDNKASNEEIENSYQLNKVVSEIKPDEKNKREIHLSIRIEGWFASMN